MQCCVKQLETCSMYSTKTSFYNDISAFINIVCCAAELSDAGLCMSYMKVILPQYSG